MESGSGPGSRGLVAGCSPALVRTECISRCPGRNSLHGMGQLHRILDDVLDLRRAMAFSWSRKFVDSTMAVRDSEILMAVADWLRYRCICLGRSGLANPKLYC